MSKTTPQFLRRIVLIGLCISILMTSYTLILAPGVGAASDATKTETEINDDNTIGSTEDELLEQRALIIDEAKKEAQEVVSEQLAIREAKAAAEAAPKEKATSSSNTQSTTSETTAPDTDSSSSESSTDTGSSSYTSDSENYSESNTVSASGSGDYLLDIDNPDPNYVGYSVSLNDADREMAGRILMGEAGGEGYIGMALVAQCIRDTYVSGSYSSIAQLLQENGYYGSTSMAPSSTAMEVVNYIFDQGGSAVQHRISVFYATNLCSSAWHESQEFVCQYNYVRFFNY